MGLVYEDERYFSACDVKKFDAEKFDRFVDNLAHDIDRYIGDARALETGYGKYYNNSTYVGKAATASKEFIDRKQFEKFHVGSKDIQRELFNRCLGVKNMFEARVDSSPKARIDNETLDLIKRDHMTFADKLEYEGYDIECIAREIESEYGKYGDVTQPNYRRALVVYDEFCGSGGFLDKCLRKFEGFNEEARQYTKRSMIKEQSNELQKDIKATASALEGMTVFKTEVQRQAVWLNALSTNQAVVDPKKLAADIKECFELTGIKYDKNAIVDANILKNATDLALLNCKSKNEKVALLACTEAVQEIVRDPMTLEAFLKALWETLALIGTTLVTIVSMAASTVGGIIAELNPVVLVVTLVIVLISGITYFASKSKSKSSGKAKKKDKTKDKNQSEEKPHRKNKDGEPLGKNGPQMPSKTVFQRGKTERVDVENQRPGDGNGNVHYHDAKDTKYIFDPVDGKLYLDEEPYPEAPPSIQRILEDPLIQKAIDKALKYLGELPYFSE
ncbi:hypothetical protein [Butyrivibrio hungatei]|uniref:hypothetical protein n=1 Tax=Butyrivibrio hungatei TaxID=185008 RepID=UPI0003F89CD1|nr:hypothetical protein [Butyrivibrio hungatei]